MDAVTQRGFEITLATDGYKLDHRRQYPENTQQVLANFTPRGSRIEGIDKVVFFGLQHWLINTLQDQWADFFAGDIDEICTAYEDFTLNYAGPNDIGSQHWRDLHALGYMPLEFKALPEGTEVPLRVPMFTVENTHADFFWLVNYLETSMSNALWMPCTSATLSKRMRDLMNEYAVKTGNTPEDMAFLGHDFSIRGMSGLEAAQISGMGHLTSFTGSDNLPAILAVKKFYPTSDFIGGGVPATEHAVMCAGGQDDELETYDRLLDLYPNGLLSVVSDTWDLWNVVTEILPTLKDKIMARDGKLVIRPDSGNPADILCGTKTNAELWEIVEDGREPTYEEYGVVRLLWEIFGGTVNDAGYRELDDHIGVIYGDSINYERCKDILERLEAMGVSAKNVVYGMGSYGFQYQTRDTFGFAVKSTNVVIDGEDIPIFKDPKTDNGLKKSLKGRIAVVNLGGDARQDLHVFDGDHPSAVEKAIESGDNLLQTVWKDGKFVKELSFDEVRANLQGA